MVGNASIIMTSVNSLLGMSCKAFKVASWESFAELCRFGFVESGLFDFSSNF